MPYFRCHEFNTRYESSLGTPSVYIQPEALAKMWHIVDLCNKEVGWLGTVVRDNMSFLVTDVFLLEQEASMATNELDPESIAKLAGELMAKEENSLDLINSLKLWGHSHVNMDVGPSGQDDTQMEEFNKNGSEWFLRAIANKKGKIRFDLFLFNRDLVIKDIPWSLHLPISASIKEQVKSELDAKVKDYTYKGYSLGSRRRHSYGVYGFDSDFDSRLPEAYRKHLEVINPDGSTGRAEVGYIPDALDSDNDIDPIVYWYTQ